MTLWPRVSPTGTPIPPPPPPHTHPLPLSARAALLLYGLLLLVLLTGAGLYYLNGQERDRQNVERARSQVFAELDRTRRRALAGVAAGVEQVLVTAAVAEDVPAELTGARFEVDGGRVTPGPVTTAAAPHAGDAP